MKKMWLCFLFASFILTVQLSGQNSKVDSVKFQRDSVKMDLNLSGEVVKKLDNKDIIEIIKYREKLAQEKEITENKENMTDESMITIWSILFILFTLSLFVIPYYFNLRKTKAQQQIILKLIEKDLDIPKELLSKPQKNKRSDLHKGIILIALGVSLCIVMLILRIHNNFWTIGLIPMFIGIGYIISLRLEHSFKDKAEID
jgi:hypothetical protein